MEVKNGDRVTVRLTGVVGLALTGDKASVKIDGQYVHVDVSLEDIVGRRPPIQRPAAKIWSRALGEDVTVELYDERSSSYLVRRLDGSLTVIKDDNEIVPHLGEDEDDVLEAPEAPPAAEPAPMLDRPDAPAAAAEPDEEIPF